MTQLRISLLWEGIFCVHFTAIYFSFVVGTLKEILQKLIFALAVNVICFRTILNFQGVKGSVLLLLLKLTVK